MTLLELEPQGHETNPPARYTEATLVRTMEELGIGRPSTYASILGTILDRGYVFKKGTALVPSFLAFAVVGLLEQHFGRLVDYDFTARMEDDLDRIAAGDEARVEWLAPLLLRRGRRRRAAAARLRPRRNRRPRGQLDRDRRRNHAPRRPLRPVPRARRAARERAGGHRPRRAHRRARRGAALGAVRRPSARRRPGVGPRGRRAHRPVRPVRDGGPAGGVEGEAAHRVALQVDVDGDGDARGRAQPPLAARASSASARTGRRSSRGTAATGRTSRRGRSRARSRPRSNCCLSRSTRRSPSSPSPASGGGSARQPPR